MVCAHVRISSISNLEPDDDGKAGSQVNVAVTDMGMSMSRRRSTPPTPNYTTKTDALDGL